MNSTTIPQATIVTATGRFFFQTLFRSTTAILYSMLPARNH